MIRVKGEVTLRGIRITKCWSDRELVGRVFDWRFVTVPAHSGSFFIWTSRESAGLDVMLGEFGGFYKAEIASRARRRALRLDSDEDQFMIQFDPELDPRIRQQSRLRYIIGIPFLLIGIILIIGTFSIPSQIPHGMTQTTYMLYRLGLPLMFLGAVTYLHVRHAGLIHRRWITRLSRDGLHYRSKRHKDSCIPAEMIRSIRFIDSSKTFIECHDDSWLTVHRRGTIDHDAVRTFADTHGIDTNIRTPEAIKNQLFWRSVLLGFVLTLIVTVGIWLFGPQLPPHTFVQMLSAPFVISTLIWIAYPFERCFYFYDRWWVRRKRRLRHGLGTYGVM